MGFFQNLKNGVSKTRQNLGDKVMGVFTLGRRIDEELFEELEEGLIQADVGVKTSLELVEKLRSLAKEKKVKEAAELKELLKQEIIAILSAGEENGFMPQKGILQVYMVTGVNGAGKTTTIGKMADRFQKEGLKVMLAAADTFRAAAIDQLAVWAERAKVPIIRHQEGADPGAVVFDACKAAQARGIDLLLIDTAGRLQNKTNLMNELGKIGRIVGRELPEAKKDFLLVLDAGTGQNAISQAQLFKEVVPLNGLILTKLDGTAKGGVIIGIKNELQIPVKWIGVGEASEDLQPFSSADFVQALFN